VKGHRPGLPCGEGQGKGNFKNKIENQAPGPRPWVHRRRRSGGDGGGGDAVAAAETAAAAGAHGSEQNTAN